MTDVYLLADNQGPSRLRSFDMDMLVGYILLIGVMLSTALLAIGLTWHWVMTGHLELEYSLAGMTFIQFFLTSIMNVISVSLRPRFLVSLGLAILMITPYVRVLVSILYFAFVERNWKYAFFTVFVFSVLTYTSSCVRSSIQVRVRVPHVSRALIRCRKRIGQSDDVRQHATLTLAVAADVTIRNLTHPESCQISRLPPDTNGMLRGVLHSFLDELTTASSRLRCNWCQCAI